MRVIVNGLSATSLSGRHVLLGHLAQLALFADGNHEFWVLFREGNSSLRQDLSPNVHWIAVSDRINNWKRRTIWELFSFRKLIHEIHADLVFTTSGTIIPGCRLPQVTLAQNPWCLVPGLHNERHERTKAFLQRQAYRYAVGHATLLAYNSEYMRQAYRKNCGGKRERDSVIAYQGLDEETHEAAAELRNRVPRQSHCILAVSVMAPWKNIETLIDALRLLRQRNVPARLNLVGPWADPNYERAIRRQIDEDSLTSYVSITGGVSRRELYRHYAEASVFCLLSRCESFGIPAMEAQLFGTPGVVSDACAMPEVCGPGAISVPPDDSARAAEALAVVLEDSRRRLELAGAAVENASRFRWSECSRPLFRIFELSPSEIDSPHAAIGTNPI